MSQLSYEAYAKRSASQAQGKKDGPSDGYAVNWFKLKNDGDEAIVRFHYKDTKDFQLVSVHTVNAGGRYKRISCLRESGYESLDACPFCKAQSDDIPLRTKFFVEMLAYEKGPDGKVTPKAVVWERPASFADTLSSYVADYPDLSDVVFKIRRHGSAGSLDTTYDLIPTNPAVYKPEIYAKDFSGFDGFVAKNHFYFTKTAEEMNAYLKDGDFPAPVYDDKPVMASGPKAEAKAAQPAYQEPKGAAAQKPAAGKPDAYGIVDDPLPFGDPSEEEAEMIKPVAPAQPAADPTMARPRRYVPGV